MNLKESTPLKVLIIEDSEDDTLILLRELRQNGFDPTYERVETLEQLQSAFLHKEWDIVLSDFCLPGLNGLEAFQWLKEHSVNVPFLIVSGSIGEETAVEAMKAGVQDYFMKGRLGRLVPAIRRTLREFEEQQKRKQAENLLRESEERYRNLVDTAQDVIFTISTSQIILSLNHAFEAVTGWNRADWVGKGFVPLVHPGDLGAAFKIFFQCLKDETPSMYELRVRTKSGTYIHGEFTTVPVKKNGNVAGMLGIARDVTERKKLEAQLMQAQKMEAVGRLAGGVAHDFNNILTVILGYSDLLMNRVDKASPMKGDVEEIRKSALRAAALTNQLLAFSRKQMLQPVVLDLNALVSNTEKMLRRLIREDIFLETILDPNLERVQADPTQMEQVLLNLSINARDAMQEGGKLTLKTANVTLSSKDLSTEEELNPGPYVLLTVKDTGCGMNPRVKEHLFEPFFTTKEQGKGTGLGLPMVYGIVKQSGGHIECESTPAQGTTFRIYLPKAKEKQHPATPPESLPLTQISLPNTVLLLEDEASVRNMIKIILLQSGCQVLEAPGGPEEALRICGKTELPIHLVVSDIVMPGMSGWDLAERIFLKRPTLKILLMSGHTENFALRRGTMKPHMGFLQKPFLPQELLSKVEDMLKS